MAYIKRHFLRLFSTIDMEISTLNSLMAANTSLIAQCHSAAISLPALFGANITGVQAAPVTNFSFISTPALAYTKSVFSELDFCNITVSYTHPGRMDKISVTVYLPPVSKWNGRFATAGGSGWGARSLDGAMIPNLDAGFAVAETDAGVETNFFSSQAWALLSPGNPDYNKLEVFASQALHDMTVIGKGVVESFYGQPAGYSYWVGRSQGGRQGNMMAQRYPDDFDGILAMAPAINWAQFFPGMGWPAQRMFEEKTYPRACEFAAYRQAALDACDALDGVKDGIISSPELCKFDPLSKVGDSFFCSDTNSTMGFTVSSAKIVQDIWVGPRATDGEFFWHGYAQDADLAPTSSVSCSNSTTNGSKKAEQSRTYWPLVLQQRKLLALVFSALITFWSLMYVFPIIACCRTKIL